MFSISCSDIQIELVTYQRVKLCKYEVERSRSMINRCMFVPILINNTSDLVKKSKFFEIFRDFKGIDLLKKCVNVSFFLIEVISYLSKI